MNVSKRGETRGKGRKQGDAGQRVLGAVLFGGLLCTAFVAALTSIETALVCWATKSSNEVPYFFSIGLLMARVPFYKQRTTAASSERGSRHKAQWRERRGPRNARRHPRFG